MLCIEASQRFIILPASDPQLSTQMSFSTTRMFDRQLFRGWNYVVYRRVVIGFFRLKMVPTIVFASIFVLLDEHPKTKSNSSCFST